MRTLTPKQQEIFDAIKELGKANAQQIAKHIRADHKAVSSHLRRIENLHYIYICAWEPGKHNSPTKVYTHGAGESVPFDRDNFHRNTTTNLAKKKSKRLDYDPFAPIVLNSGWESRVFTHEYTIGYADHVKFMERFQPRPDAASAWLFHEPKVDLQGAKYDLL